MDESYRIINSTAYDFLVLMFRMANEKEFSKAVEIHGHDKIKRAKWIEDFILYSNSNLDEKIEPLLYDLFDWDLFLGFTLVKYVWLREISNVTELIEYIKKMEPVDIIGNFMEVLCDSTIEPDLLSKIVNDRESAMNFVSERTELPQLKKEKLVDFICNPSGSKEDLLLVAEWVYENIYREKEKEISNLLLKGKNELEKLLNENEKALEILIDRRLMGNFDIPIGISVFYESARLELTLPDREESFFLVGSGYSEIAAKRERDNPLKEVFEILADNENFKIIKLLSESGKTFLSLATDMDISLERTLERLDILVKRELIKFDSESSKYFVIPEDLADVISDLIIEKLKTSED